MGFQLVAVNGMIDGVGSGFHCLCHFLCGLNTDVIIFVFRYCLMCFGCDYHRSATACHVLRNGRTLDFRNVRFFKTELCFSGTGCILFQTELGGFLLGS